MVVLHKLGLHTCGISKCALVKALVKKTPGVTKDAWLNEVHIGDVGPRRFHGRTPSFSRPSKYWP